MSNVYKYEIFECDTCNRKTSKEVDPLRPTIQNCTITYKCVGKLVKLGVSATRPKFATHERGVVNWVPRGTKTAADAVEYQEMFNDALTGDNHLTVAVPEAEAVPFLDSGLTITFETQVIKNVEFKEYEYIRFIGTPFVEGPDDSSKLATLLFKTGDVIKVYVNGIVLPDTGFTAPTDINGVGRQIIFSEPLAQEYNSIKVVVYVTPPVTTTNLVFNHVRSDSSAWGNVKKIKVFNPTKPAVDKFDVYTVFTCSNIAALGMSNKIKVSALPTLKCIMLLAREPKSNCDRILSNGVQLDTINTDATITHHFEIKLDENSDLRFFISENFISSYVPPISVLERYPNAEDVSSTVIASSSDEFKNKYQV